MVVDKTKNVFKTSKLAVDGCVRDCKFIAETVALHVAYLKHITLVFSETLTWIANDHLSALIP